MDLKGSFLKDSNYRKVILSALVAGLIAPTSAHAGVFSFVADLFSTKQVYVIGENITSNGKLTSLEPSLSPNPNPRGGAEIFIEDGSSLAGDNSPALGDEVAEVSGGNGRIAVYVVREGDTLSQIARMFGVTTNTIAWANDISAGSISPGDELIILPISGLKYEVEKGDTLKSIANEFDGDIDEILAYNGLQSNSDLSVGQEIIIPNGVVPTKKASTSRVASSTTSSGSGSVSSSGYFIRPTKGVRTQGIHGYNGVDIGAPSGTPIVAAASGEVIISRSGGWNGGYGNYIVISHANGTQTLYAHNSSNVVGVGAYVTQGEIIGYVGSTGKSTGNHLHFEVRGATNPF